MIANDTYKLEGSRQELATLLRCGIGELNASLPNLKASDVGDVTLDSSGSVTLASRRLKREWIARQNGRKRQSKFRENSGCNTSKGSLSVSNSEVFSEGDRGTGKGPLAGRVFELLKLEVGKHFGRGVDFHWNYDEQWNLSEVCKRPGAESEWLEIVAFRHQAESDGKIIKATVKSLLEGWGSELDRARNYRPEKPASGQPKPRAAATILDRSNEKPFETSPGVTSEWQKMKANLK